MGWVNRVVPAKDIETEVMSFAEEIAANAPLTLTASKLIVNEVTKVPSERDTDMCRSLVERCYASEDYVEGQRAFAEKRAPRFIGR